MCIRDRYNVLRSTFEKELRNSTGESLVSMVQSFCYLAGTLNTGKLNQQDAIVYRKAICSVMDELERLTAMVSPDSLKPSKNDAMGWVSVKNSCAKSLENINQFVKSAVNIFLEKDVYKRQVVLKTMPGLASAACAAIDGMEIGGLVGSLAGDDTAILIMRDNERASAFCDEIHQMLQ